MAAALRTIAWLQLLTIVAISLGCGATRSARVHSSGFLGDYSALQPLGDDDEARVFVKRPGVLSEYDAFILEPVLIVLHPESKAAAIDPSEMNELAEALRADVAKELEDGGYAVVDAPGPRVLRVRAAITDVDPSRPSANVAAKVAGAAAVGAAIAVPAIDLGRASIETEMRDATTDERVVAFLDARRGKRFMGTVASAQKWGHAHAAFKTWAGQLRKALDTAHGHR